MKNIKIVFVVALYALCHSDWLDISDGEKANKVPEETVAKLPKPTIEYKAFDATGNSITSQSKQKPSSFIVSMEFPGVYLHEKLEKDVHYDILKIPGLQNAGTEYGKPSVPFKMIMLDIPANTTPHVSISKITEVEIENVNIYPLQPPAPMTGKKPEFEQGGETYNTDKYYPSSNILKYYVGKSRNNSILSIEMTPVRANPKSKKALVASHIELKVQLKPSKEKKQKNDDLSPSRSFVRIREK